MKIFSVVYEAEGVNGDILEQLEYVSGADFGTVAKDCQKHADNYDKELKSVRYLFNIVKHIESPDKA